MQTFTDWLNEEISNRGWSFAEFARRAGMGRSSISQVLSGERKAGIDFCKKTAKALKIPEVNVLRRAGLIEQYPEEEMTLGEILDYLAEFSDDELESLKDYIEYRYQLQQRRGQLKPRRTGSAG